MLGNVLDASTRELLHGRHAVDDADEERITSVQDALLDDSAVVG